MNTMLAAIVIPFILAGGGDVGRTAAVLPVLPQSPSVQLVQLNAPREAVADFNALRCKGIGDLSSPNKPVFTEKGNGEWECTYLQEYPETGHTPSVFLQIRGVEAGVWSSFRLKLNFGSLLSRQVLGTRAANLVYTLIGNDTPMRELDVTLAAGREFEIAFGGITLKYLQERMDQTRFNVFGTQKGRVPDTAPPAPE